METVSIMTDLSDKEGNASYRAPRVACTLEDFEILGRAGDGTFSTVIKARYKKDGRVYAVKIVDKYFVNKHKQTHRVVLERNVLDRIHDEGIVRLYFTFQDIHNLYFVMEYLTGGELFEQIRQRKRLDVASCRFYAAEVVLILEYLRSENLVHRDLKPENLMLTGEGHVRLVDFGCVRDLKIPKDDPTERKASFVGTSDYVPPETLNNEDITCAADLWGLGCLIFQMLTGTPPFRAGSEYLTYQKIATVQFSFPDDFHPAAKDLVCQLLVEDAQSRLGASDLEELKRHDFFEGVSWDTIRQSNPPNWIQLEQSTDDEIKELDWELKSMATPFDRRP